MVPQAGRLQGRFWRHGGVLSPPLRPVEAFLQPGLGQPRISAGADQHSHLVIC